VQATRALQEIVKSTQLILLE